MADRERTTGRTGPSAAPPLRPTKALPYVIELWHEHDPATVERVLARAATMQLGRAILRAVKEEHPDRRITLRRDGRILAEGSSSPGTVCG